MKDTTSCPYCQAEEWGCSENWGMGDEGWDELERIHLEEHRAKRKMPQHGKGLARIYKNAVSKRAKSTRIVSP